VVLVVTLSSPQDGQSGQSSRFGPAPSPLITAGGGGGGSRWWEFDVRSSGTVTGATYDLTLAAGTKWLKKN
jgi:hypothetical protein